MSLSALRTSYTNHAQDIKFSKYVLASVKKEALFIYIFPETAQNLPCMHLDGSKRKSQVFADGAGRGVRVKPCVSPACRGGVVDRREHARPAGRKWAKLQARGLQKVARARNRGSEI